MDKSITKEIRQILEDCQSGRLNHDQTTYFCGTARCIAGWKVSLDAYKQSKDKVFIDDADGISFHVLESALGFELTELDVWAYAENEWQLTHLEANILFNTAATYAEQFALLEKLESGQRIA